MYDDPASFVEPHSQQEYQTVQHPEVVGGSGNLAASSYDMGYEPKKVGGARISTARAKRVAKALGGEAPRWLLPQKQLLLNLKERLEPKPKAVI
jgi:hypothetical protein